MHTPAPGHDTQLRPNKSADTSLHAHTRAVTHIEAYCVSFRMRHCAIHKLERNIEAAHGDVARHCANCDCAYRRTRTCSYFIIISHARALHNFFLCTAPLRQVPQKSSRNFRVYKRSRTREMATKSSRSERNSTSVSIRPPSSVNAFGTHRRKCLRVCG